MIRLLALLLLATLAAPAADVAGGGAQGSIRGVIYHDLDRDGVRDAGEPGLGGRGIIVSMGGEEVGVAGTGPDGAYVAENLEDGEYTLRPVVDDFGVECRDYAFTFNPYANQSFCVEYNVPWRALPGSVERAVVEDGSHVTQDFGAFRADVAVLAGIALLEGDRPPEGTVIEAVFDGTECGTTTAQGPNSELSYVLHVRGAGERAGCTATGDQIRFRIDGLDAPEVRLYQPTPSGPFGDLQLQPLTAIRDHAWLWAERRVTEAPGSGTDIEALIGQTVCGNVEVEYVNRMAGFSRFLVASEQLVNGCGTEGATMTFRTQQLDGAVTLPWSAHLREVTLRFYGDANCNYGASSVDALLLLQLVSGRRSSLPCPEGRDVNDNGTTDAIDAALVLQLSAGLIDRLPVG